MNNPLLQKWDTPFETPPFSRINVDHFLPAAEEAVRQATEEINAVAENPAAPDFSNTIEALERSGDYLSRLSAVLFNLNSAETSAAMQAAAQEVSTVLTRFSNDITLNEKLFGRVKAIYEARDTLNLTREQLMLVERKYRSFHLGGADLPENRKKRFREISEELSRLGLKFEENVLEETNAFELHITGKDDLAGLPEGIVESAAVEALNRKKEGWIFTLHFPSYLPFMQYSEKRELRERMFKAFSSRSFRSNNNDNRELVKQIVNLRLELSNLLGYECYADMVLSDRMADTRDKVTVFLNDLFASSHPAALRDYENIRVFALSQGFTDPIERWDWAYFSEKLRKARYEIDDELLRPYFKLNQARDAIFGLAGTLFGLRFTRAENVEVYHPEVEVYEVADSNGTLMAAFYTDFHPRQGKNGGAWMTCYREQRKDKNTNIRPLVSIVSNFSRPTETRPSLLTFNELTTFLHEFGHALHAILSDCTYESLSGTNVARDFVELPSQFMENYAYEKEWLDKWASHYVTGEKIPEEIIKRIREASTFNEGYACDRQLGFGFLDMAWHTIKEAYNREVADLEVSAIRKISLLPEVEGTSISCSFTHLFGGGYAAGYYGYKWAEVLDADAFSYFREKGIFDNETATSFRKEILEKGATDKPMNLYIKFRGREPSIEPFLIRSGLR